LAASGKIRLLLALLSASLLITAVTVQKTYTPVNNLVQTAKTLENNLHKKEQFIYNTLRNKKVFDELKNLDGDPQKALEFIENFTTEKSIWFITTRNGSLSFWSGVKVIPENPGNIKEGCSFIKEKNGFYEAIKKSEAGFSVIFFIPVEIHYEFQNQYLQNTFANDLLNDQNIELASVNNNNIYEVRSINRVNLFPVKLKQEWINQNFFYFELTLWMLTLICFFTLIQNVCNFISEKGFPLIALFILGGLIVFVRFVNLQYNWPDFKYPLELFSPQIFSSGFLNRSFGDFCINILATFWFVVFLYLQRRRLLHIKPGKITSYFVFIAGILMLIVSSKVLLGLFHQLIIRSKISFDVSNVLNLSAFSFLGVFMLCISFLIFYLLSEVFLTLAGNLQIQSLHKGLLFGFFILLTTVILVRRHDFTFFYLLWGCLVFIRAYAHVKNQGKMDSGWFAAIIVICAIISSIQLTYFEAIKETETRNAFIKRLENPDDLIAESIFTKAEKAIIADTAILQYFKNKGHNSAYLKTYLQKLFSNGYLSKYELKAEEFDDGDNPISTESDYPIKIYKDMVLYSAFKVSSCFYRQNKAFGFQNYFAIIPIKQNEKNYGSIVIDLKSRSLEVSPSFPDLLIDGSVKKDEGFKDYSFAFYVDDVLLSENGNYVYDLLNSKLKGRLKTYVYTTTKIKSGEWFRPYKTYSHLIYKPTAHNVIVVSKEENSLFFSVTATTFFFVVFLVFGLTIILLRLLLIRSRLFVFKFNGGKWRFKLNTGFSLYKTRIQFSLVATVVLTLAVVGLITFLSISAQYENQQEKAIRDKINRIAAAFENGPENRFLTNAGDENQAAFNNFAATYSADLTLYNLKGRELITTQPKIYDFGLQANRINARAFINLRLLQKSEYVNEEIIGKLNYKAVYVPLRNLKRETLAYLELPYFSNEADYKERVGALVNIMINVYVIVFIAIGVFAVVIARQITQPLNFIQQGLSKTKYGKKNEPIKWERNDEIGALVSEYNKMIAELENSAQRLAQSERESAWREMAKQVAHEIKNPLTPLKLGLQLLDKSWRDKDPKFDQKFERFSKSFVEQIESLSSIASEFSAFAKMPDTTLQKLNLFEILTQAVTIFKQMDNVKIVLQQYERPFMVNADRDQMLRCFNNLLKNAIEAFPAGNYGIIEIKYRVTGVNILLTIKDNGNGIPENLREKIFEPSFTTKSSGTGLGLSFVKNSIENAGGRVWFETVVSKGTTFYISLPRG
jgi:signal transduction histidine kinase